MHPHPNRRYRMTIYYFNRKPLGNCAATADDRSSPTTSYQQSAPSYISMACRNRDYPCEYEWIGKLGMHTSGDKCRQWQMAYESTLVFISFHFLENVRETYGAERYGCVLIRRDWSCLSIPKCIQHISAKSILVKFMWRTSIQ